MSNFQNEIHNEGYQEVVIIAVGQSNISQFNSNFCANSNLPLVMDAYPNLPIRDQFNGLHKEVVIIGYDGNELGRVTLNNGLNNSSKNFILNIIAENYEIETLGDINNDGTVNILDVIQTVNIVLNMIPWSELADLNSDGLVNVVDIILLVNIILGT